MKEFFSSFFSSANIIVRAKALIISAFALTGRIVFGGLFPQGVALGYVLLPLRGVLLRLLTLLLLIALFLSFRLLTPSEKGILNLTPCLDF